MKLDLRRASDQVDESSQDGSLRFRTYAGDPLAVWLLDKLRLSPLSLGLLTIVVAGLVMGVSLVIYALAFPAETLENFLTWQADNWQGAIYGGLVTPLAVGFYGWINIATGDLFRQLFRDKVFAWSDAEFEAVLTQGQNSPERIYNHWGWTAAAVAVTSVWVVASFAMAVWTGPWGSPEPVGEDIWIYVLATYPFGTVAIYMLCMIAAKEFATIYGLRRLFQGEAFRLVPLHPDGCGGLQALSKYALRFGYFLAVAGLGLALLSVQSINLGTEHFAKDYILHLGLGLYVVLAPLTFFASVGTAHARMAAHKRALLLWVSRLFDETHSDVVEAMKGTKALSDTTLAEVNRLHSLYRTVEGFPVWPFDVRTIRNFTAVALVPVLTVVVSTGVSVVVESL